MFDIFQTIFKYKEKQSPDKLGLYPESVHINAMPERRYLWTSRILVIISCLSICFNMMLAGVVYLLLPQRSAYPRLLHINDYFSRLDQTQPAERYISAADLLAEEHIAKYVKLRHSITSDFDEMKKRLGPYEILYWYSAPYVYKMLEEEADYNMSQFRIKGLRRDVSIEWIKIMTTGLWQVQFLTKDYSRDNPTPQTHIWRATLRIAYGHPAFRNREDLAKNPFGFIVLNYSLGYLGTPETSAHYLSTAKEVREKSF